MRVRLPDGRVQVEGIEMDCGIRVDPVARRAVRAAEGNPAVEKSLITKGVMYTAVQAGVD